MHCVAKIGYLFLRRRRNLRRVPTTVEPKVPIKRHVKRIRSLVFGLVLKAFANGICVFGVRNRVPADLQIGQIFSVCLCSFFCRTTFGPGRWLLARDSAKKSLKKRLLERGEAPNSTTFGTPPPSLQRLLGRWHAFSSCACGATCPAGSF